jgi:aerobic carbon-monoxide dehydrogenase small subunit
VLTGALAQVGRPGIVKEIAARLTQQFAGNLQARIAERAALATAPASAPPPPPREAAPRELNAGALLWSVVWGRLKHSLRHLLRLR